jgi:hypothetical protein
MYNLGLTLSIIGIVATFFGAVAACAVLRLRFPNEVFASSGSAL